MAGGLRGSLETIKPVYELSSMTLMPKTLEMIANKNSFKIDNLSSSQILTNKHFINAINR
jgi:hypothetical protein